MSDRSDYLDGGRKISHVRRLEMECGVDRGVALRCLSHARGDFEKARRLANGETLNEVFGPLVGPLIAYDPRCTGPIPEGLTPFGSFAHSRVQVSPALARKLAGWAREGKAVSPLRVRDVALAMLDPDQPWRYSPEHVVTVDSRGRVVDGLLLLRAVAEAGCTVELDVWHNVPEEEWARIDRGRRRVASDVLSFNRRLRTDRRG